ncbi:homoserine kinase [Sinobaca sp. H24]|uniref:homoserine kinase n=1 Tax=Sinobaca sp. H24 TaxID=2923376 RepID=UPI0020793D48|nr:homoserine kinase [Sinobaca sp. H24]
MRGEKLVVTVPASSANLGPGFDSIGLAVDRYLTMEVTLAEEWSFTSDSAELEGIPYGKDNLIYIVAETLAKELDKELPACRVHMTSNIPLARGLGSSAAAIIAGIEMTDQITSAGMTTEEKMRFASIWEGHPDNVGPCLYGGLIIGAHSDDATSMVHAGVPDIDIVIAVPEQELMTKKARGILPAQLPYKDAIKGSAVSNVLTAGILTGNWELVGDMMVRDVFHHPYRAGLVPGLMEIMQEAKAYGAHGAALSGAGPTVLCIVPKGDGEKVRQKIQKDYPDFDVQIAAPDEKGSQVFYVKADAEIGIPS